jgi:hypothetical protein
MHVYYINFQNKCPGGIFYKSDGKLQYTSSSHLSFNSSIASNAKRNLVNNDAGPLLSK